MKVSNSVDMPNVPAMAVGEFVEELSGMYVRAVEGGTPFSALPSVMLWGPPGVGKSQGVRQIASALEARTGRRADVTDMRLLLFNPIDLRGIPVPNEGRTLAVWLKPQVFNMDPSDDVVNILLLDEISAAPPTVQAAAYQITLDRTCGEHRLPDNCIVMAAGNRVSDRSTAYRMPKALANRLLHIDVRADFASWRAWAVRAGVNDKVVAYLAFRPDRLSAFDAAADDLAFATPRSWEMAAAIIEGLGGDVDAAYPLVSGVIGAGAASELRTWSRVYAGLPEIGDVFAGRATKVPRKADALYALVSAMTARARTVKDDLDAIERSIRYEEKLPADFSALLMKDYLNLAPGYRGQLMRMPAFIQWVDGKGAVLDAGY